MARLIFGCGYLGERVAARWRTESDVYAVTRSAATAERLRGNGLRPIVADITDRATLPIFPNVSMVLFAVGFDRQTSHRTSSSSIHDVFVGGLQNVLAVLPPTVERFLYISSTGVFGQCDGDWVNEDSPCKPTREGGVACLDAERRLAAHPLGPRSIILRLAGLYGPGRVPRLRELQAGRPIDAPSQGQLNLIHVEDAAETVIAAERLAVPPRTYLVSDGQPVSRADYFREICRLIGAPEPTFTAPNPSSHAAARAATDKRIDNRRMREELGVRLRYPSYREGLKAILTA